MSMLRFTHKESGKHRRIWVALVIFAVALATASVFVGSGLYLRILYDFKESSFENSEVTGTLSNGKVTLSSGDCVIFETDKDILVQDAMLMNLDRAKGDELVVLCWKRGHFGKHRPFWIKKDTKAFVQHIYIYDIRDQNVSAGQNDSKSEKEIVVKPKWMASDIGLKAKSMDKDGRFIVITDTKGVKTKWYWESFGLTRK